MELELKEEKRKSNISILWILFLKYLKKHNPDLQHDSSHAAAKGVGTGTWSNTMPLRSWANVCVRRWKSWEERPKMGR